MYKGIFSFCFILFQNLFLIAQENETSFGQVTLNDFQKTSELVDAETPALVLHEFANYYFDTENTFELIVEYHVIIKILKPEGLSEANIEIPLYKNEKSKEKINRINAASYTMLNGKIDKQQISRKDIYIEDPIKFADIHKFSIPGAKVGSIIEYQYILQTPFILNLKTWYFQNHLPKLRSEIKAKIPGNYLYNISLRGSRNLSKQESKIANECVVVADYGYNGKTKADCLVINFGMVDVPPFKEESYMTSKENFLSAVRFELYQVTGFDGSVKKLSKTWKDVDEELLTEKRFGGQLKKAKNFFSKKSDFLFTERDTLKLAENIYSKVSTDYNWNNTYGINAEFGIEKSFDTKTGSVADINLTLISILREHGIKADPMILATRSEGVVTELYPVLSEFNYVLARIKIKDKIFLLDATSKLPFGIIPIKCLNGKGRVIPDKKPSYWEEINPNAKYKTINSITCDLQKDFSISATVKNRYEGYSAIIEKSKRKSFTNVNDYQKEKLKNISDFKLNSFEEKDLENSIPSYTNQFNITLSTQESDIIYFNPFFLMENWINPFKLRERDYPVDFSTLIDQTDIINITLPDNLIIESMPQRTGKSLPNNGGKMLFDCSANGNRISISFKFSLNKTIFNAEEYHYLKELYNTIIDLRNSPIVLKQKE